MIGGEESEPACPMNRMSFLRPLSVAVLAALSACASTSGDEDEGPKGKWLPASPVLKQQIQDEADKLPYRHGVEQLEAIRWFASVGEPAYPTLLRLAVDPRDEVAISALAALGATGDPRLADPLRVIPWSQERFNGDLGYERARTLVRLGDWSEMPVLINGLQDQRPLTRGLCIKTLAEASGDDRGFDPRGPIAEREAAIRRWESWWLARTGEGLLNRR